MKMNLHANKIYKLYAIVGTLKMCCSILIQKLYVILYIVYTCVCFMYVSTFKKIILFEELKIILCGYVGVVFYSYSRIT